MGVVGRWLVCITSAFLVFAGGREAPLNTSHLFGVLLVVSMSLMLFWQLRDKSFDSWKPGSGLFLGLIFTTSYAALVVSHPQNHTAIVTLIPGIVTLEEAQVHARSLDPDFFLFLDWPRIHPIFFYPETQVWIDAGEQDPNGWGNMTNYTGSCHYPPVTATDIESTTVF